ncbi:MAG: primosomal protein N', partial [Buchnera aphidicola]|nr:primosomal protein N' [Buchnera aphidicola]
AWITVKEGIKKIVIGTKMSIFLPFCKLGLIIVYQENSSYYNHFISCKFNIRDISIFRAFQENIPIILDSDTPSLKTLYNISLKKCLYINFFDKKYIKKVN